MTNISLNCTYIHPVLGAVVTIKFCGEKHIFVRRQDKVCVMVSKSALK